MNFENIRLSWENQVANLHVRTRSYALHEDCVCRSLCQATAMLLNSWSRVWTPRVFLESPYRTKPVLSDIRSYLNSRTTESRRGIGAVMFSGDEDRFLLTSNVITNYSIEAELSTFWVDEVIVKRGKWWVGFAVLWWECLVDKFHEFCSVSHTCFCDA